MSARAHRRRRSDHGGHEEHLNHEAWVIPYADMLTLLMCLFLVLWAVSNPDKVKFAQARDSLRHEMGAGVLPASAGVLDGTPPPSTGSPKPPAHPSEAALEGAYAREQAGQAAAAAEAQRLDALERRVRTEVSHVGLGDRVGFRHEERGLVVTIVSDDVLFSSGESALTPAGANILSRLALVLNSVPNRIIVEGHTDPRPISTPLFPSNWELSTARATTVLRQLVQAGLPGPRVSAAGYSDTRPIADNSTPAGLARNRRVEIVVVATTAQPSS